MSTRIGLDAPGILQSSAAMGSGNLRAFQNASDECSQTFGIDPLPSNFMLDDLTNFLNRLKEVHEVKMKQSQQAMGDSTIRRQRALEAIQQSQKNADETVALLDRVLSRMPSATEAQEG